MKSQQNIPEWNKDGVWNQIEDRLHPKKKRRVIYWWFLGTASMALLIVFLTWHNQSKDSNTFVSENTVSALEQKLSLKEEQQNSPTNNPKTVDKNLNQEIKSTRQRIKKNLNHPHHSTANHISSNRIAVQPEELVFENIDLERQKNTPVVVSKKQEPLKKIAQAPIAPEKKNLVDSLSMLAVELSSITFNKDELLPPKNFDNTVPAKKTALFWWLESGISIGRKSFPNLDTENYRDFTKEQFRFVQTNELGIQRSLGKNWYLKSGLAYQTIYEKYEYLSSKVDEEEIFSDQAVVYYLHNDITHFESGFAPQRTTKTRFIIHNNFIHRLSVPVELAYEVGKSRWTFEPSIGFRFQFFQRFDGVILQGNDHLFDREEINNTYYSNDLGIGLISSLNLKYHIFYKGALGLNFTYERDDFFNLIKSNDFARYETIGLQLGYYQSF